MASAPAVRVLGIRKIADDTIDTTPVSSSPQADVKGSDVDSRYGWGPIKPECLQVFNKPAWFLFFSASAALIQLAVVLGFINSGLTTLEKRYQLTSSQTGIIAAAFDIGFGSLCIFVAYIGGTGHKPRWIASGMILLGLGSLLFTIPHYIAGPYEVGVATDNLCSVRSNATSTSCGTDVSSSGDLSSGFFYVFVFANVLNGMGSISLNIFAPQYMEQSVPPASFGIYQGIFSATWFLGGAAGYILGGQLLTLYIDFDKEQANPPPGGPADPRWLGAWWVGLPAAACLAWLLALPLAAYPKELPGTDKIRAAKVSEAHASSAKASDLGNSIKNFLPTLVLLAKNPTIVFSTITATSVYFLFGAASTFGPKFMETQFGITPSLASLIFGGVLLVAAMLGNVLVGVIMKWKNLSVPGLLKMCIVMAVIFLLLTPAQLLKCPSTELAGVTKQLDNSSSSLVGSSCNAECACPAVYDVVCGTDGLEYVSPCLAGCTADLGGDPQVFGECSCVSQNVSASASSWEGVGSVTSGRCVSGCWQMYVYLVLWFVGVLNATALTPPAIAVCLRSVPENISAFAMGTQFIFIRLVGSVPAPIVVGAIIDLSCQLWQGDISGDVTCDGDRGACWVYDRFTMGLTFTLFFSGIALLMVTSLVLAWYFYKPVKQNANVEIEVSPNPARRGSLVPVENFGFESG